MTELAYGERWPSKARSEVRWVWSAALLVGLGCNEPMPPDTAAAAPAQRPASAKAEIRAAPPELKDAAAVIRDAQGPVASADGLLMVYIGAEWCEPCRYFHDAVAQGSVSFSRKIHFLEFDYDKHKAGLDAAGCGTTMLPAFSIPTSEGRCGPKRFAGGIKGPEAVGYLRERVEGLLGP